jgi:SAM-dependent methyltransferase
MRPSSLYLLEIARRTARSALCLITGEGRRSSTPLQVMEDYEAGRAAFLTRLRAADWKVDDYALEEADDSRSWTVAGYLDGRVTTDLKAVRRRMMERILATVAGFEPSMVVEVGSGTGRNLLWLLSRLPGVSGVGFELTPSGVAAANFAAERFEVEARFQQADITDPGCSVPEADVVLSVHALEQLPDAGPTVDKMAAAARKAVVMFEPFPEMWPGGLAGVAHRLRARDLDRLRAGALAGHRLSSAELLPFGTALNRTAEVVISVGDSG